jgi:hypothetical protein
MYQQPRILLVEDEPIVLMDLIETITELGRAAAVTRPEDTREKAQQAFKAKLAALKGRVRASCCAASSSSSGTIRNWFSATS